jgi:hypothetical protein
MIDRHDLSDLLRTLDASELRHCLDELDGERAALLALLRAARARERAQRRMGPPARPTPEDRHAD